MSQLLIDELVKRIREETGSYVPNVDPDGPGSAARVLLILRDPGPKGEPLPQVCCRQRASDVFRSDRGLVRPLDRGADGAAHPRRPTGPGAVPRTWPSSAGPPRDPSRSTSWSRWSRRPATSAGVGGVSERHLRSMLPELPHCRIGGRVVLPVEPLRQWLAHRAQAEQQGAEVVAREIVESLAEGPRSCLRSSRSAAATRWLDAGLRFPSRSSAHATEPTTTTRHESGVGCVVGLKRRACGLFGCTVRGTRSRPWR